MAIFLLYWSLLFVCCGLTAWRGDRDGRWAAITVLTAGVTDTSVFFINRAIADLWVFPTILDTLQLCSFIILMVRSRRWWPIWITGFQIDAVIAQFSGALAPDHAAAIFRGLHTFWGIPILLSMALGVTLDHRAGIRASLSSGS